MTATYKILKLDNNTSIEVPTIYDNLPKILDSLFNESALQWHVASAFLKDYISGNVSYQSGKKFGTVDENGDYYFSGTREELAKKYHCGADTLRKVIKKLMKVGLLKIRQYLKKIFIVKTGRVSTVNFFHFCLKSMLEKLGVLNDYPIPSEAALEAREASQNRTPLESVPSHLHDLSSTQYLNKYNKGNFMKKILSRKQVQQVEQVQQNLENPLKEEKKVHPNYTTKDMLMIYNETLGENRAMTKGLAQLFGANFKWKFERDLKNWKRYCEMFKASSYADSGLENALDFKTVDRVLRKYSGNGLNEVNDSATVYSDQEICQKIEVLEETSKIKELRHKIAKKIGYTLYFTWFHHAHFCDHDGDVHLVAPNLFVEEKWETCFNWIAKFNKIQKRS